MWHAAVLRLLRRRIVLALIFCLSLTYFLVNLFGNVSWIVGWPIKHLFPKDFIIFSHFFHSQGVSLSKDSEDIVYTRQEPLVWRETVNNSSFNEVTPPKCRNSVQGRTHIVDDEGYVCSRSDLLATGCCKLTALSEQYDCDTCIDDGCCAVYEYCVSCCLNPNKVSCWIHLFDAALTAMTFYRFSYRKLYWKRCWSWRVDVKWHYLLRSEINLNCVWPNAGPIRIPCNTKTNTRIQVKNIVMVWPKHTNHSVKDGPVKCRHRNCEILIRSSVHLHTFVSWWFSAMSPRRMAGAFEDDRSWAVFVTGDNFFARIL